jgi:hypothetical protein
MYLAASTWENNSQLHLTKSPKQPTTLHRVTEHPCLTWVNSLLDERKD